MAMVMDFEALVDAQSALLGMPIAPEHRPGVVRYLQMVAGVAPRVMEFEVGPADESGNVFIPVAPRSTAAPAP
jgi:hypothetical protein